MTNVDMINGIYIMTMFSHKINITTYFENLTIEFHVLYSFNTNIKFCVNQILFTI